MTYFDVHTSEDKVTPNGASVRHMFLSSVKLELPTAGGVSRLEISSLRDSDAGEYVCQLSLLTGLLSLQHTLDVLGFLPSFLGGQSLFKTLSMFPNLIFPVRASVRALEASVTVKEGEEARLECEVQGTPNPIVSWRKQV